MGEPMRRIVTTWKVVRDPQRAALVNVQYALYDALVSINVPADKARAVVESMEQDMSTILATKADLGATQLLLKQEIVGVRDSLRQEIAAVRDSLRQEIAAVRDSLRQEITGVRDSLRQEITGVRDSLRQEITGVRDSLKQEIDANRVLLEHKLELLRSSMTIRLGSMQIVGMSLLFAALKLT
jgi:molybdate-binding protein